LQIHALQLQVTSKVINLIATLHSFVQTAHGYKYKKMEAVEAMSLVEYLDGIHLST
jgi:hypothetical protein